MILTFNPQLEQKNKISHQWELQKRLSKTLDFLESSKFK